MRDEAKPCDADNQSKNCPDDLTLQWCFAQAIGHQVIGQKGEPFAIGFSDGKALFIGSKDVPVKTMNYMEHAAPLVFQELMRCKADLLTNDDGSVTCKIGTTTVVAPDFIRAAMLGITTCKGR